MDQAAVESDALSAAAPDPSPSVETDEQVPPSMDIGKILMQTTWRYYYWSETDMNREGESLRTCLERYGVGGWYSNDGRAAALVFYSAEKSAGYSWLLGMKHVNGEEEVSQGPLQLNAGLYERMQGTFHLSPDTSLGRQITEQLAGSVFEGI